MGSSASSFASSSSGNGMSTKAQSLVENAIKDDFITVFSKSYCPYCRRAKNILNSLDLPTGRTVKVYELDLRDDGAAIQRYLLQRTGQSTVPNIFISRSSPLGESSFDLLYLDQEHIGGSDDLAALNSRGQLKKLIKAERAGSPPDDN
ncbi:glutaredoxin [Serendipita sp. 411]|nr:glutaredoxin [Serendipita sp. 411]